MIDPHLVPRVKLQDAARYALTKTTADCAALPTGRSEVDNGEVERQLRRVALGRKNYLFVFSDRGAVRPAIAYTLLASCRIHGVDPYTYLCDVLKKIGDGFPQARINELLPHRWQPTNAASD